MHSHNFEHGYAFAKKIEAIALKAWSEEVKEKSKRINAHGLPF